MTVLCFWHQRSIQGKKEQESRICEADVSSHYILLPSFSDKELSLSLSVNQSYDCHS